MPKLSGKVLHLYRVESTVGEKKGCWRVVCYTRASTPHSAERKAFPEGKPKGYRVVFVK